MGRGGLKQPKTLPLLLDIQTEARGGEAVDRIAKVHERKEHQGCRRTRSPAGEVTEGFPEEVTRQLRTGG